ncbi:MAG: formylglycine-generating enzyme family protein, partial [Planctomycetota bacterium]
LRSPARDLAHLIEVARGVAKLDVAKPAHATGEARLELVQLSPEDLSKQQLAVDPPPLLPVAALSLPTGLYQATIVGAGVEPFSFPVRIARGTDVAVEAIPKTPAGMVYVRPHKHFRAGHPRHDDLPATTIEPFFIDLHEVTVGEYREFLSSMKEPGLKKRRTPSHWTDVGAPEPADHPVTNVTLDDALAYAAFRQKDIPTEAQWQLAASGGLDDRDYPYGRRFVAAYERCDTAARPDPVSKHQHDRSPFGALDMSGNVSELVRGFFDPEGSKRLAKGGNFAKKAPVWERIPVAGTDRMTGFRCCRPVR